MKAVPKVNTDGLYIEDTIVDDTFNGVVPFYADLPTQEPPKPDEEFPSEQDGENEELEREVAGYIVGVTVPQGLFHPRFDIAMWEARELGDTSAPSPYWVEGLAPEEIEELTKPQPEEPTELDLLRDELTNTQVALTDTYEQLLIAQEETTSTQIALTDVYEQLLNVQEELTTLKEAAE